MTSIRLSPLHDLLGPANLADIGGMPVPMDYGDAAAELSRARQLGLCDVSALPRLTIKGPEAGAFLQTQGIPVPERILQIQPVDGSGFVVRTGSGEFFIEDGPLSQSVARLDAALGAARPGTYRVVRQDGAMLLGGSRAAEAFRQACGYDFAPTQPGGDLIFTRVAGVSCSVLPRELNGILAFEVWTDGTFGPYLWQVLLGIVRELGGDAVGIAAFFPELNKSVEQGA